MNRLPIAASIELPAVDYVAIEDESLAAGVLQKMEDFLSLAIFGSKVHV